MKFLLDAHMPPRLVEEFAVRGHQGQQVRILLTPDAPDMLIAQTANELGAVMVTKDADFLDLGNVTSIILCSQFGMRIPEICQAIAAGEPLVEIK